MLLCHGVSLGCKEEYSHQTGNRQVAGTAAIVDKNRSILKGE